MQPRIGACHPGSTQSAGSHGKGGPAAWPGAVLSSCLGFLELEEVGDGGRLPHTPSLLAPRTSSQALCRGFKSWQRGFSVKGGDGLGLHLT